MLNQTHPRSYENTHILWSHTMVFQSPASTMVSEQIGGVQFQSKVDMYMFYM